MNKFFVVIMVLMLVGICTAEEILTRKDGAQVILKDNFTWELYKSTGPTEIKYSEEAITVWDKTLLRKDGDYGKRLGLFLHYQNNTDKKVVGVLIKVEISNPFGKSVYSTTYEDEVVLEPNEKQRSDKFWTFEDNQFINGEPYDKMWEMADNGTAKIGTKIIKVIFADGVILGPKPMGAIYKKATSKKS